jgi:hypothetical protein
MKPQTHFYRSILKSLEKSRCNHDVYISKASHNIDRSYTKGTSFIEPSFINKKYECKQFTVHVPFSNSTILVEINFRENQKKEQKNIIQRISDFLLLLALIMKNTFGKIIPNFVLIMYMSDEKKYLPKDLSKEIISAKHVNSGVTITYTNQSLPQVIIYREEEILKVLTHEILHLCETHFHVYDTIFDTTIKETHNIKNEHSLNLFESYVETLTLMINTTIYSYLKNPNSSTKIIKSYIALEKKHSQRVVDELYYMLHSQKKYSKKQKLFPLNENTNTFSYLVIKLLFLQNESVFFSRLDANFCINENDSKQFVQMIVNNLPKIKVNNLNMYKNKNKNTIYTLYPSLKFCKFDIYKTYLKMNTIRRDINKS